MEPHASASEQVAILRTQLAALERLLEERGKSAERALTLQAEEYRRRLDDLNHAHRLATERNAEFVRDDVFQQTQREMRKQVQETSDKLIQLAADMAGLSRAMVSIQASQTWIVRLIIGALLVGAISLLFRLVRP